MLKLKTIHGTSLSWKLFCIWCGQHKMLMFFFLEAAVFVSEIHYGARVWVACVCNACMRVVRFYYHFIWNGLIKCSIIEWQPFKSLSLPLYHGVIFIRMLMKTRTWWKYKEKRSTNQIFRIKFSKKRSKAIGFICYSLRVCSVSGWVNGCMCVCAKFMQCKSFL